MSINRLRRTNSKERGKPKYLPKTEGISGRRGTITIYAREILLGILDLLLPK